MTVRRDYLWRGSARESREMLVDKFELSVPTAEDGRDLITYLKQ